MKGSESVQNMFLRHAHHSTASQDHMQINRDEANLKVLMIHLLPDTFPYETKRLGFTYLKTKPRERKRGCKNICLTKLIII